MTIVIIITTNDEYIRNNDDDNDNNNIKLWRNKKMTEKMTVWLLATFPVLFVFLFSSIVASRHAPPLPCCSHETTELKATNVR